jgi:hypothetical protein
VSDVPDGLKSKYNLRARKRAADFENNDDFVLDTPTKRPRPVARDQQTSVNPLPSSTLVDRRRETGISKTAVDKARDDLEVLRRRYSNVVNIMETLVRKYGTKQIDAEVLRLTWNQLNRSNGQRPAEHHFW